MGKNKQEDAVLNEIMNNKLNADRVELKQPLIFQGGSGHFIGGQEIYGAFDGQVMISADKKKYPVPANYASKSRLVEGDKLKLVITDEGDFIFKQIGPEPRKMFIGKMIDKTSVLNPQTNIIYKVLLATTTYMKLAIDDEVVAVIPRDNIDAEWASIENVICKKQTV